MRVGAVRPADGQPAGRVESRLGQERWLGRVSHLLLRTGDARATAASCTELHGLNQGE
jgi:hypothetical protein